jgi:hypothetical protein
LLIRRAQVIAPAVVGLLGLALFVSACGGSPSPGVAAVDTTTLAHESGALAFAHCMRSNGVENFPDPNSSGAIPKESLEQLGVSSSRFQSAQRACQHLLPNGGQPPSQAQRLQMRAQALRFAECVRSHGVPNFPDPDSSGRIPDPATVGIDQGSPKFEVANQACGKYRPPYMPSNAAYNAYARTHG